MLGSKAITVEEKRRRKQESRRMPRMMRRSTGKGLPPRGSSSGSQSAMGGSPGGFPQDPSPSQGAEPGQQHQQGGAARTARTAKTPALCRTHIFLQVGHLLREGFVSGNLMSISQQQHITGELHPCSPKIHWLSLVSRPSSPDLPKVHFSLP